MAPWGFPCSSAPARLELPDREGRATSEPEAGADFAKAAAQMDIGVGAAAIAVVQPILPRQHSEIEHTAAQARKICQGGCGLRVGEVLQHVVAYNELEAIRRSVALHAPPLPAVALTQIFARLQPDISRARQLPQQRPAHGADAAAG